MSPRLLASSVSMERLRLSLLLALALMAAGSLSAHILAYLIVPPVEGLGGSGHGYLAEAPGFFALCLTVGLAALLGFALAGARGASPRFAPGWSCGLLPPLGFALQEHLERLFHDGSFPLAAVLEPTFAVGLALQLPFAAAALLFARALARLACGLGRSLRRHAPPQRRGPDAPRTPASPVEFPRIAALAFGQAQRGPPLALSA
jgi:hypothetical protein